MSHSICIDPALRNMTQNLLDCQVAQVDSERLRVEKILNNGCYAPLIIPPTVVSCTKYTSESEHQFVQYTSLCALYSKHNSVHYAEYITLYIIQ